MTCPKCLQSVGEVRSTDTYNYRIALAEFHLSRCITSSSRIEILMTAAEIAEKPATAMTRETLGSPRG
jgi:hypothetical protein